MQIWDRVNEIHGGIRFCERPFELKATRSTWKLRVGSVRINLCSKPQGIQATKDQTVTIQSGSSRRGCGAEVTNFFLRRCSLPLVGCRRLVIRRASWLAKTFLSRTVLAYKLFLKYVPWISWCIDIAITPRSEKIKKKLDCLFKKVKHRIHNEMKN